MQLDRFERWMGISLALLKSDDEITKRQQEVASILNREGNIEILYKNEQATIKIHSNKFHWQTQ